MILGNSILIYKQLLIHLSNQIFIFLLKHGKLCINQLDNKQVIIFKKLYNLLKEFYFGKFQIVIWLDLLCEKISEFLEILLK